MKTINTFCSKLLALTLALMASVSSLAYNFGDDGLFFNIIDYDNKLAEVTYQHDSDEKNYSNLTHVTIPDTVLRGRVKYAVVGIGVSAFEGCTTLESIVLPNTINHIGVAAFSGCTALRSIDLPSSIKRIEGQVFYHCSSLVSVNIPDGITHLGNNAFTGCQSLLGIVIPNSVTSIGKEVFRDCKSLTKMIIPNSVTELGEGMFWQCSSLDSVSISTGLTTLTRGTFTHCTALRNIVVPQNITHVGDYTFYGCTNLDTIVFYNSNTTFDKYAFEYYSYEYDAIYQFNSIEECCSNQITKNMTDINTYPNRIYYVNGERLSKDLVIPEGIDTIAPLALAYTDQFKSIAIPSTMKSIDEYSLFNCSAIREVHWNATNYPDASSDVRGPFSKKLYEQIETITFGDSVEHIPANVFSNMYKLRSIVIPKNVKSIGNNAFNHYCQELKTVICLAPNPPLLGEKVFSRSLVLSQDSSKRVPIYVPNEYVDIYKEQWSQYDIRPLFPTLWGLQRTSCTKTIGEDEYGTVWGSRSYLMQEIQTTTIDGKQYIVFGDEYDRFALREENNKILVYSSILKKDLVLYDFTLEVGDSLPALYYEWRAHNAMQQWLYNGDIVDYNKDDDGTILPAETFVVTDISTITLLDGKEYKKWTFDNGMEYVEGIGSFGTSYAWNDFYQLIANVPLSSDVHSQHLVCASRNGQLLYQMDDAEMERLGTECLCQAEQKPEDLFPTLWGLQRTDVELHTTGDNEAYRSAFNEYVPTLVNGKWYLYDGINYLREENNQVLLYAPYMEIYEDVVLYDWALEVGDTLPYHNKSVYRKSDYIVTDVSTITLLDGKKYKKWTLACGYEYIESIGAINGHGYGLFLCLPHYSHLGTYIDTRLVCASRNGQLLYQMDDAEMERLGAECLCEYNSGPKKDNAKNGKIGGRPTPTQWNMLEVETKEMDGTPTILRAETFSYTLENDSIVTKGKTFYQLARQSTKDTAITQSFVGALHFGEDEDNRVYFLRDGVEYVLYDFTAELGDSIEIFAGINNYPQETTYTHVVTGKDTLENGACRMMLEVVFPDESSSVENAQKVWLAGLGSIDGIVHNAATRATKARSSETQTSVMLCAWRDDDCLYTTDHPDYDSYGCVYNLPASIKDIETPGGKYQKIIRNGHLYILRDNKLYDVLGTPMN